MPALVANVKYTPIPRIEYTSSVLDIVIEDLILEGQNLFPEFVNLTIAS